MTAKKLLFREDAREKIRRGVDTLADAVKVTPGPRGRTVIIDSEYGAPQIVNSGVFVAKSIELEDRLESPYFINNAEKQAAVLENALIVLCDQKLSTINDLVPLLEATAKSGAPLLVIAEEVDADALATLVINSVRGVVKTCAVKAPGFGDRRKAMLQDMGVLTGGQVISSELGLTLAKATIDHLGRARRVVIEKESTTIIGGAGDAQAIRDRIAAIGKEREAQTSD